MKAILMTEPGTPDVLHLAEVPTPTINTETELLIRVQAAGVNPIDTKLRKRGTFFPDKMPAILGCDGAGIVEAVGGAVQHFKPGDAVYFCHGGIGDQPGNYAEWAIADERFVAPKPQSLSFAEAAAAPLVLITAWEALRDRARLQAGQSVLIHAGAGGVGHVAIQLAKIWGATISTTVSTPEKAEFVQSLGADLAIRYRQQDFVTATLDWTQGAGVDVCFDTVGGDLLNRCFEATRIYGDVVTILQPEPTTNWKVARVRNQRISLELMLTPMHQHLIAAQQAQAAILQECAQLFDDGKLRVQVHKVFPFREAATAHRLLEAGGFMGKLVLSMTD